MSQNEHQSSGDSNIITQDVIEESVTPINENINTLFAQNFPIENSDQNTVSQSTQQLSSSRRYLQQKEVVLRQKKAK